MPEKRQKERNGFGVLMLFGLVAGVIVGLVFREPSAGAVIGFGLGGVAAALLWWRSRQD